MQRYVKICSHVEASLNSFDNGFIEKSKSLPDLNLASSPFQDHLLVHLFMEICFCPFTLLTLCWAQSPTDNCCRGSNRDEEVTVSKPEDSRSGVRLDACSAFFPDIHRFVHQEFVPPDPDRFYCSDLREHIQQKHPIYSACPPWSPQSAGYTNTSQDEGLLPSTEASQHA